ncbi:hypothetical protein BAE44_0025114, partial [Dichanthelium oligosanthes]
LDGVIKMDTNNNGSFGKLMFKPSTHIVVQSSLFDMDDIKRFILSKAPRGTTE